MSSWLGVKGHPFVNQLTNTWKREVIVVHSQHHTYTQGSFAEITNQRFSLKYQTFRQLAAAFISGSGLQSVHVLNVWGWQLMMWGEDKNELKLKMNLNEFKNELKNEYYMDVC